MPPDPELGANSVKESSGTLEKKTDSASSAAASIDQWPGALFCRTSPDIFRAPLTSAMMKLPSEDENVRVDVYVDASYKNGYAGYGFIVLYGRMIVSLGRMCETCDSSTIAEVNAIQFVQRSLLDRFKYNKIMSDCKPVVADLKILAKESSKGQVNIEKNITHEKHLREILKYKTELDGDVKYEDIPNEDNHIAHFLAVTARHMTPGPPLFHVDNLDEENKKQQRKEENWNHFNLVLFLSTFNKEEAEALLRKGAIYTAFYRREQGPAFEALNNQENMMLDEELLLDQRSAGQIPTERGSQGSPNP